MALDRRQGLEAEILRNEAADVHRQHLRRARLSLRRAAPTARRAPCPRYVATPLARCRPTTAPRARPRSRGAAPSAQGDPRGLESVVARRLTRRGATTSPRPFAAPTFAPWPLRSGDFVQISCNLIDPWVVGPSQRLRPGELRCFGREQSTTPNSWDCCPEAVLENEDQSRWEQLGLSEHATIESRLA